MECNPRYWYWSKVSQCKRSQSAAYIVSDLCFVPLENPFSFRCVNLFEVLEYLSSVKSNADGSDDLDPLFLKVLSPRLLPYFTHLFNSVLTMSSFPDEWKRSKIIPI